MIVMRVDTVITDNFCGNLEAASDEIETMRQLFTLRLRLDCFCAPCFLLLCLPRSEWFLCAFNSSYIVEILESLGFPIFFYSKNFNLDTAFYYFHPVVKDSLIYNLSGESLSLFLFFFFGSLSLIWNFFQRLNISFPRNLAIFFKHLQSFSLSLKIIFLVSFWGSFNPSLPRFFNPHESCPQSSSRPFNRQVSGSFLHF